MATAKSVEITNLDTVPRTTIEPPNQGGVKVWMDTIAAATTDIDDDDILLMAELPSECKVLSIKIFNDDLDSNGSPTLATDVGIYNGGTAYTIAGTKTEADAVIDRDAYASASAVLQAAVLTGTEVRFEAANVNAIANYMWEDAGLASDPRVPLRIALTMSTVAATAVAGDVTVVVTYVV